MMSDIKLFDRWDTDIEIEDPGLKGYLNVKPVIVPKTYGRYANKQFHKSTDVNVIERIMNRLYVSGHRGKKHLLSSGQCSGKSMNAWKIMVETLEIIENKTKKNPVEVVIRAIENAALREEITSFKMGGVMARKAVIAAPQRRIDLALRMITQGSYHKTHSTNKPMARCLSDEILAAYEYDSSKSHAIREKERIEREASGAR